MNANLSGPRGLLLAIGFFFFLAACSGNGDADNQESAADTSAEETDVTFELTSAAFEEGQAIPVQYTCDGEDISPALAWTGVPADTQSLALINDDPDAPGRIWVHWVFYDLPPDVAELAEGLPTEETLPNGAVQGTNDFRRSGYGGPCPPSGQEHRYFFKLYALDTLLELEPGATKQDVLDAMDGHILAEAQLMGTYQRQ